MAQLTKKEAIAMFDRGEWKNWTPEQVVKCQLYQERTVLPFDLFKKSLSQVLGRQISTVDLSEPEKLRQEVEKALNITPLR
jgi:hypothetical protein